MATSFATPNSTASTSNRRQKKRMAAMPDDLAIPSPAGTVIGEL